MLAELVMNQLEDGSLSGPRTSGKNDESDAMMVPRAPASPVRHAGAGANDMPQLATRVFTSSHALVA